MLQLSLSQLRANSRRFLAVFLAVLLSVAFLAATLLVGASTTATLAASIGASYTSADLVVFPPGNGPLQQKAVDVVEDHPMVATSYGKQSMTMLVSLGSDSITATMSNQPADPEFNSLELHSGRWPSANTEVTVDQPTAEKYKLTLDSTVSFTGFLTGPEQRNPSTMDGRIVGITKKSPDPLVSGFGNFLVQQPVFDELSDPHIGYRAVLLRLADGVAVEDARDELADSLDVARESIQTPSEYVENEIGRWSGGQNILSTILTAFAAVALLVAVLVVSNTFSVLVTQRTRELALMRCIGAKRSQVLGSVLLEAAIVGFLASICGVVAAIAAARAAMAVIQSLPDVAFATLDVPISSMLMTILLGTALTMVASLAPAREAFKVSPLASLRPLETSTPNGATLKIRVAWGLVLIVLGAAGLVFGARQGDIFVAMGGGIASFIGVLVCLAFLVTGLIRSASKVVSLAGVPGEMAASNVIRNPRRTSSTAAALLIGVTLVTMMMTGAASIRTTFDKSIDGLFPVDMTIQTYPTATGTGELTQEGLATAAALEGITSMVQLKLVGLSETEKFTVPTYGLSTQEASRVITDPLARPVAGKVLLPKDKPSHEVSLSQGEASVSVSSLTSSTNGAAALVLLESFPALPPDHPMAVSTPGLVFIAVDSTLGSDALQNLRMDLAKALDISESQISGAAIDKATLGQVLDAALLAVLGLLGIAVIIAFIGVNNTITLSVLERTRENSLLRALGLSRSQLRWMLILETLMITSITVMIGITLGAVYGAAAVLSGLGSSQAVAVTIPFGQICILIGLTLTAGLCAALLPAKRATKLSPIEGIQTE